MARAANRVRGPGCPFAVVRKPTTVRDRTWFRRHPEAGRAERITLPAGKVPRSRCCCSHSRLASSQNLSGLMGLVGTGSRATTPGDQTWRYLLGVWHHNLAGHRYKKASPLATPGLP